MSILTKLKFDKILEDLSKIFVDHSRSELIQYVENAQKSSDLDFSNDPLQQVLWYISNVICNDMNKRTNEHARKTTTKPIALLTSTSSFKKLTETDCIICHEDLQNMKTKRLQCHHCFHEKCLNRWIKEQPTCPICRNYTLLDDDFPPLC